MAIAYIHIKTRSKRCSVRSVLQREFHGVGDGFLSSTFINTMQVFIVAEYIEDDYSNTAIVGWPDEPDRKQTSLFSVSRRQ